MRSNRFTNARRNLGIVAVVAALAVVAGCTTETPSETPTGPSPVETVSITYAVSVPGMLTFPIDYYALEGGFFNDESLNVTIQALGGGSQALQALAVGKAQFSSANLSAGIGSITSGQSLVGIFTRISHGVFEPVALDTSGVSSLSDLEGKKIGVASVGSAGASDLKAMLSYAGVDDTRVEVVAMGNTGTAVTALQSGDIDAYMANYLELLVLDGQEMAYADLTPDGFPYNSVGPIWVTTDFADENADVVERFGRALAAAGDAARDDPDTAFELLCKAAPAECGDRDAAKARFTAALAKAEPFEGLWGNTPIDGVDKFLAAYEAAGLTKGDVPRAKDMLSNKFVESYNK